MTVGIDFLAEQINGGPLLPLPGHDAAEGGWREPESRLTVDAAADEWSRQLTEEAFMESGADLIAMDAAVATERARLLAELPSGGSVAVDRTHEWSGYDGTRMTYWQVVVWPVRPQGCRPSPLCGIGRHEQSLTAAGDMALSDLRTKAAVAISQAKCLAPIDHVAPVAVVAADSRAA